jgi:putative ATP-binding cassette transporter
VQKRLTWFTNGFGQAATVFPFIVAAPRFFSGAIALGELMQIASAFGRVQDALSWLVDNYDRLAAWHATTERLHSFETQLDAAAVPPSTKNEPNTANVQVDQRLFTIKIGANSDLLATQDLSVQLPDGSALLAHVALAAKAGDTVLLGGPSGSGKSTLFRTFAGIWPHAQGEITVPANAMFIPQRAYFPDGSLRAALAYPEPETTYSDAALTQALGDVLLPQLAARLDEHDVWGQKLSGGEQQRLALARVLLKKPQWLFADEATSALDAPAQSELYSKLTAQLAASGGALISIAHRPEVARWHTQRWTLVPTTGSADGPRYRLQAGAAI